MKQLYRGFFLKSQVKQKSLTKLYFIGSNEWNSFIYSICSYRSYIQFAQIRITKLFYSSTFLHSKNSIGQKGFLFNIKVLFHSYARVPFKVKKMPACPQIKNQLNFISSLSRLTLTGERKERNPFSLPKRRLAQCIKNAPVSILFRSLEFRDLEKKDSISSQMFLKLGKEREKNREI